MLCAGASSAAASPIAFAGGQLDGTLRFFRSGTVADDHIQVLTLTLGHEYVLGTDFFPGDDQATPATRTGRETAV